MLLGHTHNVSYIGQKGDCFDIVKIQSSIQIRVYQLFLLWGTSRDKLIISITTSHPINILLYNRSIIIFHRVLWRVMSTERMKISDILILFPSSQKYNIIYHKENNIPSVTTISS